MPNIKEIKEIIKLTPSDQAIMLIGIHGIGKSEIAKQILEEMGYATITFFLGQLSDVGDLIGLPDRTEVEFDYGGQKTIQKITEFCPPKWWPRNDTVKFAIIMDEFNRGKPEIYNCVLDFVLNNKMNGLSLPKDTIKIALQNPSDERYGYDVKELDMAVKDRFNIYNFKPTSDEWIDYAIAQKFHNMVIGFITKNKDYLDPPMISENSQISDTNQVMDSAGVFPSRRSWERVSKLLYANPTLYEKDDGKTMETMLIGIVGLGATSKFISHYKDWKNKMSGATIVTNWNAKCKEKLIKMTSQEIVALNKEIAIYLDENETTLFDCGAKERDFYCHNVFEYLKTLDKIGKVELCMEFSHLIRDYQLEKQKSWPYDKFFEYSPLTEYLLNLSDKTDHDKKAEEMLNNSEPEVDSDNE